MAIHQTVTVLDQIAVSPPPETTAEISIPLTFIDVVWLVTAPVHRLIFYHHPISRTDFVDSLIPRMKDSLSQTLRHYSPLAGRVIVSPDKTSIPEIRYVEGDTIPLVIAEFDSTNSNDFSQLVSNDARSSMDLNPLIPRLLPCSRAPDGSLAIPLFALQVTLFPDVGICIGVTNHHTTGDGSSIFQFMKAWAFFSSHREDDKGKISLSLPSRYLPVHDRTLFKDPKGSGLAKVYWDLVKTINIEESHNGYRLPLVTDKVRSTFVVTRDDIQRLKNRVLARSPKLVHVSSFTVTCSYVWSCLVRSRNVINKEDKEEEMENFLCLANCRARLDPPLPTNYFGNCVVPCLGSTSTKSLMEDEGFVKAAEAIGEGIRSQLYNDDKDGVLRGAGDWLAVMAKMRVCMSLAGSPKFDYYELDFGWGKPEKFDIPSIDLTGATSVGAAKDHEGGLEVGLALSCEQMESFARIFSEGLKAL
ncbi:unnamed protein product [Cuscuta europaea]|uniref:Uncharacterized protein n=1 Tax=Cuscuta europaea TaxID=41803 RepID=A0A9P0ZW95_CUSEU|nr:unnamed protein product [Cuscuta europaea]